MMRREITTLWTVRPRNPKGPGVISGAWGSTKLYFAWSFYLSKHNFAISYPWEPIKPRIENTENRALRDVFLHAYNGQQWHALIPRNNPTGSSLWLDAYVDNSGKGLVITRAAPVYHKENFMGVVTEAGTSAEAIALCLEHKPDILLLDLNMPDMDGLEATRCVLAQSPAIKILVLTMHESEEYALRLLRAGVSGFLVKGISPEELPDAIRKVAAGDVYITDSIMKRITMRQALTGRTDPENPLACLSDREMQVFILIARGKSFQNVSDELKLSISTVGTYKSRGLFCR